MLRDLPIDMIVTRADARIIDDAAVAALAESIGQVGLISPITVRPLGSQWETLAGAHRLAACRSLGLAEVPAFVTDVDDLHAKLIMIDENLRRKDLSPAERAQWTADRKAIYETLHPETKHGAIGGGHDQSRQVGDSAERFTADTAASTGKSERSIQRDAERGEKVIAEVLDLIKGTPLDKGTYLDKLKRLPPSEQYQAAERDLRHLRREQREKDQQRAASKVQADVKARAAKEVAEMIAEHVPGEWWDAIKSNLYAAGAKNVADALTNITGEAIMDRRYG